MKLTTFKQSIRLVVLLIAFCLYSASLLYIGNSFTKGSSEKPPEEKLVGGIVRPAPEENVQSARVLASNVKLCANTQFSFEVAYPSDWFTTYNSKEDECLYYAPYSFVVPLVPQDYFSTITIKLISPDEWEGTVNSLKNPNDLFSIVSFKNLEINDRPVSFIEAVSTGSSLQKGFVKITYLVNHSEKPVEVTYVQQSADENLEVNRKVIEDMVRSLRYF